MHILYITHSDGFYSCCTVRIRAIINYYDTYKIFPDIVDSSKQFGFYKINENDGDITNYFFKDDNKSITEKTIISDTLCEYNLSPAKDINEEQFTNYKLFNYSIIKPIIEKYFTVSNHIEDRIKFFEQKYTIDYDNTCAVFYRGNDKTRETYQPSFDEVIEQAIKIKNANHNIQFLIQTDVTEFAEKFKSSFCNVIQLQEIPTINNTAISSVQHSISPENRLECILLYNAAIQIIAKCKNIICTSGNGELWIMFYRGHANGVYQYLKPANYNRDNRDFWI
jgi:hypothetical protein